jgi:hypothetical protein
MIPGWYSDTVPSRDNATAITLSVAAPAASKLNNKSVATICITSDGSRLSRRSACLWFLRVKLPHHHFTVGISHLAAAIEPRKMLQIICKN